MRWSFLVLMLAAGCSGGSSAVDPGASGPGTSGADGGNGPGDGSSDGGPGPASTTCDGLVVCGSECTVLDEDALHCGACNTPCADGGTCWFGACRPEACAALSKTACGSQCVNTRDNPAHCGGCDKPCAAGKICHNSACVEAYGRGTSCTDPIVMPGGGDNGKVAFTFAGATETQVLTCGEPTARPRRVFRFTASQTKARVKFQVVGGVATDDLVLEVFSDAPCEKAQALGCNDDSQSDDRRPELTIDITSGKTYFLVVSSKGPPPAGRFYMKFDD